MNWNDLVSEEPHLIYPAGTPRAGEGQCDCACADPRPGTHPIPTSSTTLYRLDTDFTTFPLRDGYHVGLGQTTSPLVLNRPARTLATHFTQPRPLDDVPATWTRAWGHGVVQEALTQMATRGPLVPAEEPVSPAGAPTTLSAWLHVTDRCNLRCSYCYLPHQRLDMSPETGRAAIDATIRSARAHQYDGIKLKYAGGEALIHFQLVAGLHRYAQAQAAEHGLTLDGVVLSNGTLLTKEIVATMQALGLRLMISLDGLGEGHDGQRAYAGGRGSAADATKAVELALARGLTPDISVTISGRNAAGLPELMAWTLERDLPFSLNFYRENDLSASFADLKLEEETIIAGMQAAFAVIAENLPRRSLLPSLVDRANLAAPHARTCGVGHSYLVFDPHGRVAKCQMQLDRPVADTRAADPLALVRADSIGIQNVPVTEKEGCRTCEWKYWCAGGCPLATHRATGRYDVKSPNCNIYKALYPEAVRLEGLRLLKYAGMMALA